MGTDRTGDVDGPKGHRVGDTDGPKGHRQTQGWTQRCGWTQWAQTEPGMDPKGIDRPGDGPGDANGPKGHRQTWGRRWTRRQSGGQRWPQRAQTDPGTDPAMQTDPKSTDRAGDTDGPEEVDGPKGHTQSRGWTQRAQTEPGTDPQTHTEPGTERRTRTAPGTLQRRGRSPTKGRKGDRGSAPPPPPPPRSRRPPPPARTPPPTPPTAPHRYGARSRPRRPEVPCSGAEPPLAEPSGIGRRSSAGAVGRQRTRRQNVHRSRLWPSEPPPGAGPWECREESSPLRLFLHTGHVSCCGRSGG